MAANFHTCVSGEMRCGSGVMGFCNGEWLICLTVFDDRSMYTAHVYVAIPPIAVRKRVSNASYFVSGCSFYHCQSDVHDTCIMYVRCARCIQYS